MLAAAEVSWEGKPQPGELGGFPSWGTWALLPPLPGPANDPGLSSFSSVTPAAAALVRRSSWASPSMATELDDRCPTCRDDFCYQRILRWAESRPECPLCKRGRTSLENPLCNFRQLQSPMM
uniref:Uncharacterized protein n=1 Tax=Aquila chrysaetos chrysaetos TaxID=223781 RepID=A0A663F9S4_AQUCH